MCKFSDYIPKYHRLCISYTLCYLNIKSTFFSHLMPRQQRIRMQQQDQEFHYSSSSSQSSKFSLSDKIQQFNNSSKKLKQLIAQAKTSSDQIKNRIIFNYCGQYSEWKLEPQQIINIMNKRIQAATRNKKIKKNWCKNDLRLLIWILHEYCHVQKIQYIEQMTKEDWQMTSSYIPASTADSCMFRILGMKSIKLSVNNWNRQQEILLKSIIEESDKIKWKTIAQKFYNSKNNKIKIFRTSKQCKQHWNCYLNPKLKKGPWTVQQDIILLQSISKNHGKKRWVQLVRNLEGRTENALKNRFNFLMSSHSNKQSKQSNQSKQIRQITQKLYGILYKQQVSPKSKKSLSKKQTISNIRQHIEPQNQLDHSQDMRLQINNKKQTEIQALTPQNLQTKNTQQIKFFPIMFNGVPYWYYIGSNQQI